MKKHKFVRSKEKAQLIWIQREYYRLENFITSDICKIFLELYPHSQLVSRKNHYHSFIRYFQEIPIQEITTSSLNQWFNILKKDCDLSERTMAQVKCQLTPMFKWLVMEDIIQSNPIQNIKFKRNVPPKRARCVLNDKELKELVEDARKFDPIILHPYLYALIQTGARRSEVAKLRWDDIDLENNSIVFKDTKNGSDRKIYISESLRSLIMHQNRNSEYVFANYNGKFLNRSAIERMVISFKKQSDFKKNWHIHDLRHSFASNFLKNKGEMYQLQAILGHKSIQMTVDLYGNLKSHDVKNPSPYSF
jgi:integrase/recombinase XerD